MKSFLTGGKNNDRRIMLLLGGAMLLLIVIVSVFAPATAENNPVPTTYNTGPQGAKAAFLLLGKLGRNVSRWKDPLDQLGRVQAERSTLVIAQPTYDEKERKELSKRIQSFLDAGGRVLITGRSGALLLPGGKTKEPATFESGLCYTTPEGPGALAAAGEVEISDRAAWAADSGRVEQMCGQDAVVVRLPVGKGEAIWWTSSTPLSNAGLKKDGDLRLFLASLGEGRDVLFDESLHGVTVSMWDAARGLPLRAICWQTAVAAVLLILSFSRRRGPTRLPVTLPRSSPVEFAESMGDLYEKAGATAAATDAARRRLLRVLQREAGLSQTALRAGPDAIAEALTNRLGGEWGELALHLRQAAEATDAPPKARNALKLVRSMDEDVRTVRGKLRPV